MSGEIQTTDRVVDEEASKPYGTRYLEIHRELDAAIKSLSENRSFFTPGEFLTNRMGGGEKKVIHIDGFESKDRLTWDELSPYLEQDTRELDAIAQVLTARGLGDFDAEGIRELIVGRMIEILANVNCAMLDRLEMQSQFRELEGNAEAQAKLEEEYEKPVSIEEGRYRLDIIRMNASFMKRDLDALLYLPDGTAERINLYSVGLVAGGVFQKGSADWDQHYADSPLKFWNNHLSHRYGGSIDSTTGV